MPTHESLRLEKAANGLLATGGLMCFLALVYVIHRFGLTSTDPVAPYFPRWAYYLLPAISSILLFGSLRLSVSIKVNLALLLSSTAISLYSLELILEVVNRVARDRATLWTPTSREDLEELVRIAKEAGVAYDTRSTFDVVMSLRSENIAAVPAIVLRALLLPQADGTLKSGLTIHGRETLVLGGIGNRMTVFCNESGEWITYLSDEHGFNNPVGIWTRSQLDVVVLGDSYAQGACVPPDANSAALIRQRFPGTLNLGMLGNGPLTELAQLREYADAFRPKIVLWFFYEENDFADLDNEAKSPLLRRYLKEPFRQDLVSLQPEVDKALDDYVAHKIDEERSSRPLNEENGGTAIRTVRRIVVFRNLRQRLGLMYEMPINPRIASDETMALLRQIFTVAKATVESWGGTLYVVYLPGRDRYANRRRTEVAETSRKRVLDLASDVDVPVIDIASAINSHDDPLSLFPFRRRGHYNEDGYRLVAKKVLESISNGEPRK